MCYFDKLPDSFHKEISPRRYQKLKTSPKLGQVLVVLTRDKSSLNSLKSTPVPLNTQAFWFSLQRHTMGRQLPQTRSVEGINYKLKACSLKEVSTHFIFNKMGYLVVIEVNQYSTHMQLRQPGESYQMKKWGRHTCHTETFQVEL